MRRKTICVGHRGTRTNSIEALNHQLRYWDIFSNNGQFQLEDCAFTSSRARPDLPTDDQLRLEDTLQLGSLPCELFPSKGPLPVLLHACQESRHLLQTYGYVRAFSTRTSTARDWFSFSSECFYLRFNDIATGTVDDKSCRVAQFARQDLRSVRKLR